MESLIKAPDLIIYLRASVPTLVKQIQKRGRDYENSIRLDYLKRLNERYEAWSTSYESGKILVDIETRQVDKTLGLAQKVKERRISQEQSYLYDENEILYLPKGVGIVFGQGLPQKVSIAPIQVTKSYEAIEVHDFGGAESVDLGELVLED